jgi:hypothetical protein
MVKLRCWRNIRTIRQTKSEKFAGSGAYASLGMLRNRFSGRRAVHHQGNRSHRQAEVFGKFPQVYFGFLLLRCSGG